MVEFMYQMIIINIDSIKVNEPDKEPIKSKEEGIFLDIIQNLFN